MQKHETLVCSLSLRPLTLFRANKLRAEVQLPSMQADDSWLRYFESAFDKAAKVRLNSLGFAECLLYCTRRSLSMQRSVIDAQVDQIHEELNIPTKSA